MAEMKDSDNRGQGDRSDKAVTNSWRGRNQELHARKVSRVASRVACQYCCVRDCGVRSDEKVGQNVRPGATGFAVSDERLPGQKPGRPRNLEQLQPEARDGV